MDDLDLQFGQTLLEMTHGLLVSKLLFDGRLGPGFVRSVLVQIHALRDSVALYIPLHAVHGRHGALIVIKTAMHGVCGIINVSHVHTDWSPAFEPVMMGAIDLNQLAKMCSPLTPLPVFPHFALLVGNLRFVQP